MGSDTTRIALLSLDADRDHPHSNRRLIVGCTVLERQVDIALAIGCQRIWVFAPGPDHVSLAAQHLSEKNGAQFRLLNHGRQILGGLRQQDELVALAEGLVIADRDGLEILARGQGILRFPAEDGIRGGFERLDRDFAWAGAMVLPGRIAEHLDALPEDIDPVAALLRAGRAARVAEHDLPPAWLAAGAWTLAPAEGTARMSVTASTKDPSLLDETVLEPVARAFAGNRRIGLAAPILAAITTLGAISLTYFAVFSAALGVLAAAIFLWRFAWVHRQVSDPRVFSGAKRTVWPERLLYLPDAGGVTALTLALLTEFPMQSALYLVLVTYALWVLGALMGGRDGGFLQDRELLWLGLAVFAGFGYVFTGVALATGLAIGVLALAARKSAAITRA